MKDKQSYIDKIRAEFEKNNHPRTMKQYYEQFEKFLLDHVEAQAKKIEVYKTEINKLLKYSDDLNGTNALKELQEAITREGV